MEVAAKFRDRYHISVNMPLDLAGYLTEVLFRDDKSLRVLKTGQERLGKRPDHLQPEMPDTFSCVIMEHLLYGPGWCTVGDKYRLCFGIDDVVRT